MGFRLGGAALGSIPQLGFPKVPTGAPFKAVRGVAPGFWGCGCGV